MACLSYTGLPGYELYVPAASATAVFEAVVRAGRTFDIRPLGTAALDALRIDAGLLAWGRDMTPATGPSEAGLERFVRTDKPVEFIGRDAFVGACRNPGAMGALVRVTVDDPDAYPIGGEVVRLGTRPVGLVTSAAFSPRHGRAVAFAHLQPGHGGRVAPGGRRGLPDRYRRDAAPRGAHPPPPGDQPSDLTGSPSGPGTGDPPPNRGPNRSRNMPGVRIVRGLTENSGSSTGPLNV